MVVAGFLNFGRSAISVGPGYEFTLSNIHLNVLRY